MTDREAIFLSGIDQSIRDSDIKELFAQVVKTEPFIRFHYFSVLNKPRIIVEVLLPPNDAILAHQHLNNCRLKSCYIKLIPKNSMKALIITNLPAIISEKDLFLMIARETPGLKRIIIADDPEICGKTLGLAVATYQSYEFAREALGILNSSTKILGKPVAAVWKDPSYDIIGELSLDTRVLYIKNISPETNVERLKGILSKFGNILTIKMFQDRTFVEYDDVKSARRALEQCQEKKFDGLNWRIFPAKKLDDEKAKENSDRNIVFSKNFLDGEDQQVLLKFIFGGTLPDVDSRSLQRAGEIIQAAKAFHKSTADTLRQRYEQTIGLQNNGQQSQQILLNTSHANGEEDGVENEEHEQGQIEVKQMSKTQMRKQAKKQKDKKKNQRPNSGMPSNFSKQNNQDMTLNMSFGNNEVHSNSLQFLQNGNDLNFDNTQGLLQKGTASTVSQNSYMNNYGGLNMGSGSPFGRAPLNSQNMPQNFQAKF